MVLPVGFFSVPYEASIQTTYWGSHRELAEVIALGARGLVKPTVATYALRDAVTAHRGLADDRVEGRAVIVS